MRVVRVYSVTYELAIPTDAVLDINSCYVEIADNTEDNRVEFEIEMALFAKLDHADFWVLGYSHRSDKAY